MFCLEWTRSIQLFELVEYYSQLVVWCSTILHMYSMKKICFSTDKAFNAQLAIHSHRQKPKYHELRWWEPGFFVIVNRFTKLYTMISGNERVFLFIGFPLYKIHAEGIRQGCSEGLRVERYLAPTNLLTNKSSLGILAIELYCYTTPFFKYL